MKFHTTLRIPSGQITLRDADEITDKIREQGYPGPLGTPYKIVDDMAVWECEFIGDTLDEIAQRYSETVDGVRTMVSSSPEWTANPDDPVEHAQRTARDVLEWERHFDGISLPDDMRTALRVIAGEAQL